MSSVWALWYIDYDQRHLVGLFLTKDLARDAQQREARQRQGIWEEHPNDPTTLIRNHTGLYIFQEMLEIAEVTVAS